MQLTDNPHAPLAARSLSPTRWVIFERQGVAMALILLITLGAVWLRVWRLSEAPPGLEYDEAMNGLDAMWMLKTQTPYLFVRSTQGREALFLYPLALFIDILGAIPFALRLTSSLAGILAIPLLYRLTLTLFRTDPHRRWLALIAAASLTVSLWHLSMSRVTFRAILLPIFFMGVSYCFWRGWQVQSSGATKQANWYFVGAGIMLGLSQYTYIPARLLPLIFFLWVCGVWLITRSTSVFIRGGRALLIMSGVSLVLFIPLGLLFLENPAAFGNRIDQVNFQLQWTKTGVVALGQHVSQALSLFFGGADPRIRHHLIDRPVFDWLTLIAFWSGLVLAVRRWFQPEKLFLLLSLFILWLPGPLSIDPIHNLRTSGILPAFYILMSVGLFRWIKWAATKLRFTLLAPQIGLISLGVVLLVSGGINTYDYFVRWATHPLVYEEYKGPSIDLAQYVAGLTETTDVIVPYNFYAYAPVRYLFRDRFREELALPFDAVERLDSNRPVIYFNWLQDSSSSALIWLTRDETGQGVAYLTNPRHNLAELADQPVLGRRHSLIATSRVVDETALIAITDQDDIVKTVYVFADHIRLAGYEIRPSLVSAEQPGAITFYWQGLQDADLAYTVFIQILDDHGEPVGQLEEAIIETPIQYYENRAGFVAQQHLFWLGPDAPAGLYLLRMGLFEPKSGQRLPLTTALGEGIGDQIILAPFYVLANGRDPRAPDTPVQASLGEAIDLLGYSLSRPFEAPGGSFIVKLYWQASQPIENNYTAFVQLLDAQNQVVSQWDTQPLAGLYPTVRWTPGQVISTEFPLVVDNDLTGKGYRLVTGMYDFTTGQRLPAVDAGGQPLPEGMIVLKEIIP